MGNRVEELGPDRAATTLRATRFGELSAGAMFSFLHTAGGGYLLSYECWPCVYMKMEDLATTQINCVSLRSGFRCQVLPDREVVEFDSVTVTKGWLP